MANLGALVVRIATQGLAGYKADVNEAATATANAAKKIEQSTTEAGNASSRMDGSMGRTADAARAVYGAVGLAGVGVVALAAGLGLAAYAAHEGAKEQQAYDKALIMTGNVAGTTAGQMQGMAASIGQVVGTQGAASAALAQIASTGQVAGYNLQAFTQTAVQMERVVGAKVADTAKVFADLGAEPVKASLKLNESMNYLTASTFSQIKAAQELGDKEAAASIAQDAYSKAQDARMEQIKAGLGTLEKSWMAVQGAAKWAWDSMLNLGRPESLDEKIKAVTAQLDTFAKLQEFDKRGNGLSAVDSAKQKALQDELKSLSIQAFKIQEVTYAEANRTKTQKDGIAAMQAVDIENERALSKQQQMTKALDAYQDSLKKIRAANPTDKRLDVEQVATTEAAIRKRFEVTAKAGRVAMSDAEKGFKLYDDLMAKSTGFAANYTEQTQLLDAAQKANLITAEKRASAQAVLDAQQPGALAAAKAQEQAEKDLAKSNMASTIAYEKELDAADKSLEKTQDEISALREKTASLGLTKDAVAQLAAQHLEDDAAALERRAANAIELGLQGETTDGYLAQAKALRDLAAARRDFGEKSAEVETAKLAAKERKRGWEETDRLARDVFVTWAEDGSNAAQKIGDTLKKALLSAIYEATLKPLALKLYSSVTGAAGFGDVATSMGSNSLINGANTASSLSSFGGAAAQYWTGSSAGASSASLAYANGVGMVGGDSIGALSSANGGWAGVNASGGSAASGAAAGGSSASSMIPIIGWIIAGMTASSSMYDQGHRWDGKYNALEPVMGATDGVLQGIGLDGKTAAIVSGSALIQGVLDKVGSWFDGGHEYTVGTGVQGKFSNGGFSGRNYQQWQNDGSPGIFGIGKTSGSSGTNYSAMGSAASNALGDGFVRVTEQVSGFAQSLGLSTDTIKGFSKDITVALGSDAAANKAAIDAMFAGIADDMSAAFLGTYETTVTKATGVLGGLIGGLLPDVVSTVFKPGALMKEGETASVTLVRLSTSLGQVNNSFDVLGKELLSLSLTSGDSASKLVDLLGGMDAFKATTSSYYEAFYTEGERNAKLLEQLTGSFDKMGVALPDSLQTYRDLVNAQDVNTESGRAMYASLMGMSGAFAQVTKAADAAANSVLSTLSYSNYVDYASAASASGMKALPRFAAGGMHAGGLRLVGENGPEIEATGPARIWNADQMAGALRGGPAAPTSDAAAAEIRAQREEARSQYRSMSLLYGRMLKIFEDWDRNGMPPGATA